MTYPSIYDGEIRIAAERHIPEIDWRLYKAQLIAESGLDPNAVSPKGARGIAQIMPDTWTEIATRLGFAGATPHSARCGIVAGAYYMRRLWNEWTAPRPVADRVCLALASYNAGLGNVLEAQKAAGGANGYAEIAAMLPSVTGDNAGETLGYVKRIWGIYAGLLTG